MSTLCAVLPLLLLLPSCVYASGPTNIFIDTISAYSSLAPCARNRVSAIIRAQSSGCGDDRQTTSFSCFCSASSTAFDSIISAAVATQCASTDPAAQVSSALDLFGSYCAQGDDLATTIFSTLTSLPTPAPTASSAQFTASSSSDTASNSNSLSGGAIAGIVIGVVVGVIAIAAIAFFLWRRRRRQGGNNAAAPSAELPASVGPQELEPKDVKEMGDAKKPPIEVGDGAPGERAELPASS